MKSRLILCSLLALFTSRWALGQQSASGNTESHRYRTVFTLAGGGGGFALGMFAGLAAFDDAINSDRKVWTTAALSGVGGAVAGYFIGRALDKRQKKTTVTWMREELERRSMPSPWTGPRPTGSGNCSPESSLPNGSLHDAPLGLDHAAARPSSMDLDALRSLHHLRLLRRVPEGASVVNPPQLGDN